MDEGLLREIVTDYLVPLFSGAQLAAQAEPSTARHAIVALLNPQAIGFKARKEDAYRLVLNRSQPFTDSSTAVVSDISVVRAFIGAVASMEEALATELKHDLLSTFQRRVVASAIAGDTSAPVVLSAIDRFAAWADRLYEGAPIAAAIGFANQPQRADSVTLDGLGADDFGAVLSNGYDTLLEFDFEGRLISHQPLQSDTALPSFCPARHAAIAKWTAADAERVALCLNRLGEILIIRGEQLLFARRSGKWHFLTHGSVIKQMNTPRGPALRAAMYETCLDASFARTGACIGAVSYEKRNSWRRLVVEADQLDTGKSEKARAVNKIVAGRKFHRLDRRLRQELTAIDGATVVSHEGDVLAVGAILKIPGGSTGGGRMAAAKALSELGLGIKVSQDGGISGFRGKNAEPVFRVM